LKNRRLEEKRLEQTAKFNKDKIDINEVFQEQVNLQIVDIEDNDKSRLEPTHILILLSSKIIIYLLKTTQILI